MVHCSKPDDSRVWKYLQLDKEKCWMTTVADDVCVCCVVRQFSMQCLFAVVQCSCTSITFIICWAKHCFSFFRVCERVCLSVQRLRICWYDNVTYSEYVLRWTVEVIKFWKFWKKKQMLTRFAMHSYVFSHGQRNKWCWKIYKLKPEH